MATLHRNASLDGLRGLAVLMVILTHHTLFNAGWIGVDLFFVLSGYLITTILRRTHNNKAYWKEFWIKRSTRILPALFLILVLDWLLTSDITASQFFLYLLSFGDLLALRRPDFHTLQSLWSLAVEEHFYILWPFAVRFLNRKSIILLLSVCIVLEPCLRGLTSIFIPGWRFVYYLTPFRLDGLSLGCLLAVCMELPATKPFIARWSMPAFAVISLIYFSLRYGVGIAFTRDGASVLYNSLCYTVVALLSTCVVGFLIARPDSTLVRVFQFQPLTFLGTISYGVYLYHVLVSELVMRYLGLSLKKSLIVDFPLLLLFSWISFKFYEKPITDAGKAAADKLHSPDAATRLEVSHP